MGKRRILDLARKQIGVTHGSAGHRKIVNEYNAKAPRPVGYRVLVTDDWCDVFITWLADTTGQADLIGRECGVQRHLNLFRNKGIWKGRVKPHTGDIVIYDWQGHNAGWADHIGIVERLEGNNVIVIEGNSGNPRAVRRRTIAHNHNTIVGYARPEYASQSENKSIDAIAQEVIRGEWGNNPDRAKALERAGFDAKVIQYRVDDILKGVTKDVETLALEVIAGAHGKGTARKDSLGSLYDVVQARVNELSAPTPRAMITVDGYLGTETMRALQVAFGTPVDGIASGQAKTQATQAFSRGAVQFGTGGSTVVKALQRKIGAKVDGIWGKETTTKLQRYLGTFQDGIVSRPSNMVKELQRRLNNGTF